MATTGAGVMSPGEIQHMINATGDISKAISTSSVTGLQLRREDLQEQMVIMAPLDTPLRNRLKRIQGQGGAHDWFRLIPTAAAEGNFLGAAPSQMFFAAGGLPTLVLPNYQRVSAPYRLLGDMVTVSWHDQAAGRTYQNIRSEQIKTKMLNTSLCEEWAIINGNSTLNSLQFDGLDVQITNSLNYGTPTAYGLSDPSSDFVLQEFITYACQAIAFNGGLARCVVYSYPIHSMMSNILLHNLVRIWGDRASLTGIGAGISVKSYDFGWGDVDLIKSRYVPQYSYGSTIYVLDDMSSDTANNGNTIQMVDLDPISAVDLGLVTTAWNTVIYEDTLLMVSAPAFNYKVQNVVAGATSPH